jgi:glycerol-3-phosphate cytidylyltransferase
MFIIKKKIGYADIVGDLFHSNHIKFLKKCKEYCDYLIVGVCTDEYCKPYKRIPILNEEDRLFLISECKYVDKCFLVDENQIPIKKDFINKHNIDYVFHAHSKEEHEKYKIYYNVPINMDKFIRLDYGEGISTSSIINKISKLN